MELIAEDSASDPFSPAELKPASYARWRLSEITLLTARITLTSFSSIGVSR